MSSVQPVTDELDRAIIAQFQRDGRLANREVARRLGVSEGTIRQRLRKLEETGAVRFDVVTDPACEGINYVAFVRLAVAPDRLENVLEVCAALPELWYVAATAGRFNLIAVMSTVDAQAALHVIRREIEVLAGVVEVDVRPVLGVVKHDYNEIVIRNER